MFFFFNDTATTEIYTLSLHDALPILAPVPPDAGNVTKVCYSPFGTVAQGNSVPRDGVGGSIPTTGGAPRSEEHTSELQSQSNLVCRLLLETKDKRRERPLATSR